MAQAPVPSSRAIDAFGAALRGQLLLPGNEGYETARRVFNGMIDRRPRVIVKCADVADVIHCVKFAREEGLAPAIRGGSHSVAGLGVCDDGIVIDLSRMKGIHIDPVKRVARVEGGCTWGDVDHATHAFGLAMPGGIISTTGVGGLTTGGGFGYLTRRCGLACDNLISADVVGADGALRTASATENADLFWAIRGGGGNFGVVTSFEFRLHSISAVYAGPIVYPLERASEVMRLFSDFMREAPRELSAFFAYLIVPPAPTFPEALHMKKLCGIVCAYCGDVAKGDKVIRPLLEFGPPLFAHTGPVPYPTLQQIFDPLLPSGLYHYWKGDFTGDLTDEIIGAHAEFGPRIPTVNSAMHIYPVDGAVHDVAAEETAFAYREVRFTHVIAAVSHDPAPMPEYREWVRDDWASLHAHSAGGAYVNFLMEEGEDRIAASYRHNLNRLKVLKAKYDPDNLFRINQNIKPAAQA